MFSILRTRASTLPIKPHFNQGLIPTRFDKKCKRAGITLSTLLLEYKIFVYHFHFVWGALGRCVNAVFWTCVHNYCSCIRIFSSSRPHFINQIKFCTQEDIETMLLFHYKNIPFIRKLIHDSRVILAVLHTIVSMLLDRNPSNAIR